MSTNFFKWWIGWMILVGIGFLLFHLNPNAEFKKKYFRVWLIFGGVAFVVFAWGIGIPVSSVLLLILPMATLITFLNLKIARICGHCGRHNQKLSSGKLYCRGCGMEIID